MNINSELVTIVFVHMFDHNISQDVMAVLAIIMDDLERLK
jgi:hypothetical protein